MELKRNKETGIVEAWEDDKKVGEIITMGDMIMSKNEQNNDEKTQSLVDHNSNKDNKEKGTAFAYDAIGKPVPHGYVKKVNKDGTISYVPPKKSK